MSNKTFWKIVKPFLANQPCMASDGFSIDKDEDAITDEKVLVEFFNENYRIIIEISPGDKPSTLRKCKDCAENQNISKYSAHPSFQKIKISRI